ncbi:MAG TPA: class I SAM-dependent methyltransferase [Thermoanaerobaculia bacterium]|nr:class I SAM-dependent methyltransferase [Thermoanaerobaculia bacterium]
MISPLRRLFFRSDRTRALAGWLNGWLHPERRLALGHLAFFHEEEALGPIQREEALLLFALVRVLRPALVVELGFHRGHSALNFVAALDPGARLVSFDIAESARELAEGYLGGLPGFRYIHKSQTDLSASDFDGQKIDLVLLDAAHDVELNQRAYRALEPCLAPGAVIAVHDTGVWQRSTMRPSHHERARERPAGWFDAEQYQPWPEERQFVNWLRQAHPELAQLHLHSERTVRHGLTLLQRSEALPIAAPGDGPSGT